MKKEILGGKFILLLYFRHQRILKKGLIDKSSSNKFKMTEMNIVMIGEKWK